MAKKETYSVRINFKTKKEFDKFKLLQSMLVILGVDESEFWARDITFHVEHYIVHKFPEYQKAKMVVDSETLRLEAKKKFGIDLTRTRLFNFRNTVWNLHEHYFAAPQGDNKQVFRYDLRKCLAEIQKSILPERKIETYSTK